MSTSAPAALPLRKDPGIGWSRVSQNLGDKNKKLLGGDSSTCLQTEIVQIAFHVAAYGDLSTPDNGSNCSAAFCICHLLKTEQRHALPVSGVDKSPSLSSPQSPSFLPLHAADYKLDQIEKLGPSLRPLWCETQTEILQV